MICAVIAISSAAAPTMVERAWFYPGINGFSMGIVGNADNDDVVVLYNTYCDRNGVSDNGLFVAPPSDAQVGDVLPVPDGYTPKYNFPGASYPTNAGTVAYVGKPKSEPLIEVNGLEPGTQYFIAIYSRNAAGEYSDRPLYTGTSTYLQYPYTSQNYDFPRVYLPYEWYSDSDVKFIDKLFWDEAEGKVTQGTNAVQQSVEIPFTTDGSPVEVTLEVPMVHVNTTDDVIIFEYNIRKGTGQAYNDWAEGDVLAIRVSTDGGSSWENIEEYTAINHKAQSTDVDYVDIRASLEDYESQNVQVQLYWKTYATSGPTMNVNSVCISEKIGAFVQFGKVTGLEADVTSMGEEGKVILKWDAVDGATGYSVAYKLADAEDWIYEYSKETQLTLGYLTAGATYVWKVRVSPGDNQDSEFSDEATFTMPKNTSIDAIDTNIETITVVTVEGIVVLRDAEPSALNSLPDGFYLVNGKKYLLRK